MCGISGIVQFNPAFNTAAAVKKMNSKIAHRGPDDEGFVLFNKEEKRICFSEITPQNVRESSFSFSPKNNIDDTSKPYTIALAHRRLSILDLSPSGHQPMCSQEENIWITFNGEIYNYKELREQLQQKGYSFVSHSDTEVIINSYKEWGNDCVNYFNGMWAFVIYDQEKNILFASRDRFGVKPFYYSIDQNKFLFASEQKALLHSGLIEKKINPQAAFDYLSFNEIETTPQGLLEGIIELEPAHNLYLDLSTHKVEIKKYYSLTYNTSSVVVNSKQINDYVEAVKEKVISSVKLRLRADVEVGSCLSGGLDSSVIVGLMHHLVPKQKIHLYTAGTSDKNLDESSWAKKVVDHVNGQWHLIQPTSNELLKDLEELTLCQDIPLFSTSTYAQWRVMKQVKESGIKVVLDGQGGDELFGGYAHHKYFLARENNSGKFSKEWLKQHGIKSLPTSLLKQMYKANFSDFKMISDDLYSNYSTSAFKHFKNDKQYSLNERLASEFYNTSLKSYLKCEDRCSMWFSVESRVPFADDIELIELLFSIPGTYKIINDSMKHLLKESIKGYIPEDVRLRKDKLGYVTPNNEWLYQIKEDVRDYFSNDLKDYINLDYLNKNYHKFFDQRHLPENRRIFKLLSFAVWKKVNGV